MRGQVWAEVLVVAAGIVLGVFLAMSPLFSHLGATKVTRASSILTLAEVYAEQNMLIPYSVTLFEVNGSFLFVGAYPSSARIADEMNKLGVEVYPR